jgi:DNA-binding PadR family transcriptional regulator
MQRTFKRAIRRVAKSFRDIAVLAVLSENEDLNGSQIMEGIYKRLEILLPSGTVYSTLYALEREQLVKGVSHSKCRTYTLTSKGHAKLEQIDELVDAFNLFVNKLCGKSQPIRQ